MNTIDSPADPWDTSHHWTTPPSGKCARIAAAIAESYRRRAGGEIWAVDQKGDVPLTRTVEIPACDVRREPGPG